MQCVCVEKSVLEPRVLDSRYIVGCELGHMLQWSVCHVRAMHVHERVSPEVEGPQGQ